MFQVSSQRKAFGSGFGLWDEPRLPFLNQGNEENPSFKVLMCHNSYPVSHSKDSLTYSTCTHRSFAPKQQKTLHTSQKKQR